MMIPDTALVEGYGLHEFEGDISKWDVSSLTKMTTMFLNNKVFNGDISEWNVSTVTDMSFIFAEAKAFNSDISK